MHSTSAGGRRRDTVHPMEETLRRLTIGDPALIASLGDAERDGPHRLDERTEALLRIAAMIALDAPQSFYGTAIDAAMRAGLELEDVVAVLGAIAVPVGAVRVIAAAPRIALAAGYDVEAALEQIDPAGPVGKAPAIGH